jgi:hypothetical protein
MPVGRGLCVSRITSPLGGRQGQRKDSPARPARSQRSTAHTERHKRAVQQKHKAHFEEHSGVCVVL